MKDKQHILILRALDEKELKMVQSLAQLKDTIILVHPEVSVALNATSSFSTLSEEEKKAINYQTLEEILAFGDTLVEGKPIARHLNVYGADLWYYHKFRIYFKVLNLKYIASEIDKNLAGAESVILFVGHNMVDQRKYAQDKFKVILPVNPNKSTLSLASIFAYGITAVLRLLISLFFSFKQLKNKKVFCIDTTNQYREILSLDGTKKIFENAYLGYLYQKKGNEIAFIDQLLIPKFKGTERFIFDKKLFQNHNRRYRIYGERIMARALCSFKILKKVFFASKDLQSINNLLNRELSPHSKQAKYLEEFNKLKATSLFYLFKYLAYNKFFKTHRLEKIISTDENSSNFKIIHDAAKCNNIFTVGYQHGSLHELQPSYIYSKTDMLHPPVPHLTITWGDMWSRMLINKGNYGQNMVFSTGQIRTDVIRKIVTSDKLHKSAIMPLAGDRKVVLFATQPQRDPSLRYRAAEDVILACKGNKEVFLVLKIHPRENDLGFYEQIAKKHLIDNYMISKNEELYIMLHFSDLVITCFSTVGSEALYFNKPLVILDHLKQDVLGYIKDGVAFRATNALELKTLIDDVLSGRSKIQDTVLQAYLAQSTHAIDGEVSERVWARLNLKEH